MRRIAVVVACLLATSGIVLAQDPIAQRRDVMKGVGAATRTGTQMAKGDIPFDLAKAKEVLSTYAKAAANFHEYFPTDSKTGGQTTAAPAIWENQADFRARFDAWGKDIQAASASTTDLATFRESFGTVTKACGACHNTYRIKT